MVYLIMGVVLWLLFFVTYREGLNQGLEMSHKPIKNNPEKKETLEEHKANKAQEKFIESINNILSYDGTDQKAGE